MTEPQTYWYWQHVDPDTTDILGWDGWEIATEPPPGWIAEKLPPGHVWIWKKKEVSV